MKLSRFTFLTRCTQSLSLNCRIELHFQNLQEIPPSSPKLTHAQTFDRSVGKKHINCVYQWGRGEDFCTDQSSIPLPPLKIKWSLPKNVPFCTFITLTAHSLTLFQSRNSQNKNFVQSYWPQFLPSKKKNTTELYLSPQSVLLPGYLIVLQIRREF